jgi:hypothetical protein
MHVAHLFADGICEREIIARCWASTVGADE